MQKTLRISDTMAIQLDKVTHIHGKDIYVLSEVDPAHTLSLPLSTEDAQKLGFMTLTNTSTGEMHHINPRQISFLTPGAERGNLLSVVLNDMQELPVLMENGTIPDVIRQWEKAMHPRGKLPAEATSPIITLSDTSAIERTQLQHIHPDGIVFSRISEEAFEISPLTPQDAMSKGLMAISDVSGRSFIYNPAAIQTMERDEPNTMRITFSSGHTQSLAIEDSRMKEVVSDWEKALAPQRGQSR